MHEAARYAAENAPAQLVVDFFGRGQVAFLIHLDERADDVGLTARFNLTAHVVVDEFAPVGTAHKGADGLASRRQLLDERDIEVAVDGQGHRARDWRRRHDEHIGHMCALLLEFGALRDAEAVLFVRDDEAEAREMHGVLN